MMTRTILVGLFHTVEVREDGTGVVRQNNGGNVPVEITSSAASKIERAAKTLVDELAKTAMQSPAPWSKAG
jgi:hypothetical protein